jgi:PadR family transcriptional regulator, regulatory protein PadR
MKELPRLSGVETLILELLAEHKQLYGLEMVEASKGKLRRGTVYVTLGRMEEKGFVTSKEVEGLGQGPSRTVYRITGTGARVLAAWQTAWATFANGVRA